MTTFINYHQPNTISGTTRDITYYKTKQPNTNVYFFKDQQNHIQNIYHSCYTTTLSHTTYIHQTTSADSSSINHLHLEDTPNQHLPQKVTKLRIFHNNNTNYIIHRAKSTGNLFTTTHLFTTSMRR